MPSMIRPAKTRFTDAPQLVVSRLRIATLRATYLLLVIGLGLTIVPDLFIHPVMARGVIPSLLIAIWLLALIGLRYPVRMLPLLLYEFAWKTIWLLAYGLPQWLSGQLPQTFTDDAFAIGMGVILMPIVIPWGFVWHHYVVAPSERW